MCLSIGRSCLSMWPPACFIEKTRRSRDELEAGVAGPSSEDRTKITEAQGSFPVTLSQMLYDNKQENKRTGVQLPCLFASSCMMGFGGTPYLT